MGDPLRRSAGRAATRRRGRPARRARGRRRPQMQAERGKAAGLPASRPGGRRCRAGSRRARRRVRPQAPPAQRAASARASAGARAVLPVIPLSVGAARQPARGRRVRTMSGESERGRRGRSTASWPRCSTVERFDRPRSFRAQALLSDPAVYEQAAADPQALVGRAGARSSTGSARGSRCSTTPTRRSTSGSSGGTLNVSYNCLDRHVAAGRGERVAFHWRGEEGEERDITYAQLLADVQRFANALKELGRAARATSSGSTCR